MDQKCSLRANCRMRGSPIDGSRSDPPGAAAVAVIRPKFDELIAVFGLSKFARLITLNASKRASRRHRSVIGKLRLNVTSTLSAPGPCSALRPELPDVPIALGAKAAFAGSR